MTTHLNQYAKSLDKQESMDSVHLPVEDTEDDWENESFDEPLWASTEQTPDSEIEEQDETKTQITNERKYDNVEVGRSRNVSGSFNAARTKRNRNIRQTIANRGKGYQGGGRRAPACT
ncbi:MAG: hypothetical protein JKX76_01945 [Colwellia sp.]|nr:hypothetical protein [Colwellia sp.]